MPWLLREGYGRRFPDLLLGLHARRSELARAPWACYILRTMRTDQEFFVAISDSRVRSGVIASVMTLIDSAPEGSKFIFGTLTYAPEQRPEPGQIRDYWHSVRRWARKRGITVSYVWVMELHKSGRPHYHFLVLLPKGITLPMPDRHGWKWGMSNVKWAWNRGNSLGRYLCKYLTKSGHSLPGFRRVGLGGLKKADLQHKARLLAPNWIKPFIFEDSIIKKWGSLYVDEKYGQWFASPYRARMSAGGVWCCRGVMHRGYIVDGELEPWDGGLRLYCMAKYGAPF